MASRIIDADDELQNYDEINNNLVIASRLLVRAVQLHMLDWEDLKK